MKKVVFVFWIFLLPIAILCKSPKDFIRKGNQEYKQGKYQLAEENYRKSLELAPNSVEGIYNLGNSLYKQNKFDEAIDKFNNVERKTDSKALKSDVYYNLGNAYLKNQKYKESIEYYKKTLKLNPNDLDAKYNLEYARRMLALQEEQQKNQQNRNQQDQNQQKQKQNQNQQNQASNQESRQDKNQQKNQSKLSQQNIESILNALRSEEKKTQKEVKAKLLSPRARTIEKNW